MGTSWLDVYKARMDEYARKVDEYGKIAERAGFTSEHPFVKELAELSEAAKLPIPVVTVPKLDITPPEIPKIYVAVSIPPEWKEVLDKLRGQQR